MTVDVPCESTRPLVSRILPSAEMIVRPLLTTRSSARTMPVSALIGREKLAFVPMPAKPTPSGKVECAAHPVTRVDQRQRPATLHAAERIEQIRSRRGLEQDLAIADLDHPERHGPGDRRSRQQPVMIACRWSFPVIPAI